MTDTEEREQYQLTDRYRLDGGRVFLSGSQALARIAVDQLRADRRAGLNTAAFISGYQGSPLAGLDRDIQAAIKAVPELPVVFQPGLNEELAATSVMGSQLAATLNDAKYDGVVGLWYGKAPGLDRASDALRHAAFVGASQYGGAVAIVGDDPNAKSSTLPSSSDASLYDLHMPILFPGDPQEVVDLGRHAVALSRASGLWTSMKIVAAVADGSGTVDLRAERIAPVVPTVEIDGRPFVHRPSGRLLTPYTLDMEREFQEIRLDLARRYGVDNDLNHIAIDSPDAWIGIAASGYTYRETLEALALVGLRTPADIRAAGIRLLHLRLPIPLDTEIVRRFAHGLTEIVVVEDKNPTLEMLITHALYASNERPVVVGKQNPDGSVLLPKSGMLDADIIAPALRKRLGQRLDEGRLAPLAPPIAARRLIPVTTARVPYFCSGCPHNTSTEVPAGTLLGGGIGCHTMVVFMDADRVGDLAGVTAMGNEGAQWIGMAPFVEREHLIQNLGDGTFFHSGSLAIRAAVAANVNVTYKILYNGTVAMTGGQDPEGQMSVPTLVRELLLEGAAQVLITTDEPAKYRRVDLPAGIEVWHRDRMIEAQEKLRDVPGVTVLVHDQRCAAELRRDRKRGAVEAPPFKVVINDRVCEGCGDCGDVSNCLSVQPYDTPWGRKTHIDQTSCNFDLSCMKGDCPSFMTVVPAKRAVKATAKTKRANKPNLPDVADLPAPEFVVPRDCTIRMSGIGGTGVITVSQIVGTAAMLDGLHVRGLDQTGLSQKAGPVVSDLRLSVDEPGGSNKAATGEVDTALAFDLLVGAGDAHLSGASPDRTVVVASLAETPTGVMVRHPDTEYPDERSLRGRMDAMSRAELNRYADTVAITNGLFGDATTANVMLLGIAFQAGAIPVRADHLEKAIELNGVAVQRNIAAFRWGRRWSVDPAGVQTTAGMPAAAAVAETTDELIERLAGDLVDYQSARYAARFREVVATVVAAEGRLGEDRPLTDTVARNLYKLMAYKDEYEVARLALLPEAVAAAEAVAGKGATVRYHLHPPVLKAMGLQRKVRLGRTAKPAFAALRRMKGLRGHWYDPFGRAAVRRLERAMIPEYVDAVRSLVAGLNAGNRDDAIRIAGLPDQVRGYEDLKLRRARSYRDELAAALAAYR
jgi:indolepyruvate ferredoxin oxidoreductase